MELMKEIDKLAQDYTPPVEVVEDIRTERMLKSMTPPKVEKEDKKPKKSEPLSIKTIFHSKK